MARLSSPPGMPSGLEGFLDLRGTAIPIVRMDRLFGLPAQEPGLHTPLIVLRGVPSPMGIMVDSVRGIVPVSSAALVDIPEDRTFHGCATAAIHLNSGLLNSDLLNRDLIHLLSPAALLDANEVRMLAQYCAMSRMRLLHLEEVN